MHFSVAALVLAALAGPSPTREAPAKPRPAVVVAARRQARVENLADRSGWPWRAAGITLRVGYHPRACCHWGVYDRATRTAWFGPSAFASQNRLRYTVLHELGHAWQFSSGQVGTLALDLATFGQTGPAAFEAGADCVAAAWGVPARSGHYWRCPPAAQALVNRRLAGDWG
jgi:hypothetical protein